MPGIHRLNYLIKKCYSLRAILINFSWDIKCTTIGNKVQFYFKSDLLEFVIICLYILFVLKKECFYVLACVMIETVVRDRNAYKICIQILWCVWKCG